MDLKDNLGILMLDICENEQFNSTATVEQTLQAIKLNSSFNASIYNISVENLNGKDFMKNICANIPDFLDSIPPSDNIALESLQFYLTGITGVIVCILGCMGNGLSMAILRGKMYTSSTNLYLLALAASDILLLVFALLLSLNDIFDKMTQDLKELNSVQKGINNFQAYTFPYVHGLVTTFQTISIWLVLAFTVDRYIMICHPFQGQRFCNRKRATIVVACLYVFGFLYNIPKFLENETVVQYRNGHKLVGIRLTEFGQSKFYLEFVHLWSYLIFIFVLPCLTLAVLNFQLIITVKQSKTKGRRLSLGTTCNHRNDTTLMLIAVVVVFLVCQMPALISHTVWASMPNTFISGGTRYNYLHIILEISNFLIILNSAINILLYYVFSHKFREAFIAKFCKPFMRRSKLLMTALRRQLNCCSSDTASNVELSLVLDLEKTRAHRCHSGSSASTTMKQSPDANATRQSTVVSFSTMLTSDGTSLITSLAAEQLSSFISNADTDNISQYSGSSDSTCPSDPIHV